MARRQVSIFINGQQAVTTIKSVTDEKRKLVRELNRMVIGSEEYNDQIARIRQLDGVIQKHKNSMKEVESNWAKISAGATNFLGIAGIAFTADAIIAYGKELFRTGVEMDTLGKKAETVFQDTLPQVTEQAEANAAAMGLTTNAYIQAATAAADLLIPMGFQRQEAAALSTNLVDLSGALSEWTGGQKTAQEVSAILTKALLGEREEMKSLGISISEADVQARLAEKGMKNLTGQMLEQAKAAVTLELITQKSADAQAAYAENSDELVRKQAELFAKFNDIQESLAVALIPVYERLLSAVTPLIGTFSDFVKSLVSSDSAGTKAQATLDILGVYLKNVWEVTKAVFEVFSDFVKFISPALELIAVGYLNFYNTMVRTFNGLSELLKRDWKLQEIDIQEFLNSLNDAEKAAEKTKGKTQLQSLTGQDAARIAAEKEAQLKAAEEAQSARQKQEQAELKALQQKAEKLRKEMEKIREEDRVAQLSEDEKRLEAIRKRYQDEIDLAKELETSKNKEIAKDATAQRIELERLQADALKTERETMFQEELARIGAEQDEKTALEVEKFFEKAAQRKEAEQEINDALKETVLSEQDQALLDLEAYYENLIQLARQNGIDTNDLEIAYRRQRDKLLKDYEKKEIDALAKSQAERAKILQDSFTALGSVIQGVIDVTGNESRAFVILQKGLTLAQIAIDTAAAISSLTRASEANPANPVTFGAAGVVQFATGLARILANIANARNLIKGASVPQRKMGGYATVRGADDKRLYMARLIGQPSTGLLDYPGPVLTANNILANEAGREYYVSHRDLSNPKVLNHVRAIDNIVSYRQMQNGGFAPTPPPATGPAETAGADPGRLENMLDGNMGLLNELLTRGVSVQLDDNTLVAMQKRMNELVSVSKGRLL